MTAVAPVAARREGRRLVDRLARLGLGARGVVYLLVAWISARIALQHSGQEADRQGAMQQIAHNTPGKVGLLVMAGGFFGHAPRGGGQRGGGFPDRGGAQGGGRGGV